MIVTTAPTRSGITSGQFHGSRSGRRAGVGAGGRSTVLWVRVQPSSSIVSYGRRTSSLRASASRSTLRRFIPTAHPRRSWTVAPGRCGGHVAVHGRDKYLTLLACGGVALGSQ
jgi:hypothetical protein